MKSSSASSSTIWWKFALVMGLLAAISLLILHTQHTQNVRTAQKSAQEQMARLSTTVKDALSNGQYDKIDSLFEIWSEQNEDIVKLDLLTRSGFSLGHLEKEGIPERYQLPLQKILKYGYRGEAKLLLVMDTSYVYQSRLIITSAVLGALLIVFLFGANIVYGSQKREREALMLARMGEALSQRNNQLSAEHALLQAVIDSIPDPIYYKAPDGTYSGANRAYCNLLNVKLDQIVGHTDDTLFDNEAARLRGGRDLRVIRSRNEHRMDLKHKSRNGSMMLLDSLHAPYYDQENHLLGMIGIERDITELREFQDNLESMAYHDPLTGLPNRRYLIDRMQTDIAATRRSGGQMAICTIDLDGFKPINDRYGHETGDRVIIAFASRLKALLREEDTVARWGGDEFTVLLREVGSTAKRSQLIERMLDILSSPFEVDNVTLKLTASIGITLFPDDDQDADTLLRHADQAMYESKQSGKNTYTFFDPEQNRNIHAQAKQLSRLARGINNNELRLHYQPQINMLTGKLHGVEALVRWQHPEQGLLQPGQFLHLLEGHPLSIDLDWWVIERTLQQIAEWPASVQIPLVGVNVTAMTLQQADFVSHLQSLLERYPETGGKLQLEILETSALQDISQVSETIERCRRLRVPFAIDDFGTGYSSLTYLRRLPAETLKIDRSFVGDMLHDKDDHIIVEGIVGLGEAFDRTVLAEGVESVAHGEALLKLGCVFAQGYGIGRPMPPEQLPDWIDRYELPPEWVKPVTLIAPHLAS